MIGELDRTPDDELLWDLLGVVELTYHPALAVAVLLAIDIVVSPVPAVVFDPLSLTVTSRGVPLTTMVAVVVVVDLATDIVSVYATDWTAASGAGDE